MGYAAMPERRGEVRLSAAAEQADSGGWPTRRTQGHVVRGLNRQRYSTASTAMMKFASVRNFLAF
jgi:hypothetical protein